MMDRIWAALLTNIGAKIVSIILAIILWLVVFGSRIVEVTKEIPLEIITASEVVVSNDVPDRLSFRLSGPKGFLRAVLDRREDPVRVNLATARPGLATHRFLPDSIRLPLGVKVVSITPASIVVKLEAVKRRDVPVKLELRGTAPEGYRIVRTTVKPSVVRIKGAESRIDAVTEVTTNPIDVSNVRQSLEREVALDLSRYGVVLDGDLPQVQVEVEPISANYRIKNVDIKVLSSYKVRLEEKTITVMVRIDAKDLKLIDKSRVYAVVDLRGKPRGKYVEPVKVTVPEGVGLVRTVPERVTVTLY